MPDWRKLTPVYVPALSTATLLAQGNLFWLGDGELKRDAPLSPHWHDTYELGYFRSGHGFIVLGDQEHPYQTGQVYIINDLEPHMGYSESETTSIFVVHFHPRLVNDSWLGQVRTETHLPFLPDLNTDGPLLPLEDSTSEILREILGTIRSEAAGHGSAWEVVVGGLILQGVGHLARRLMSKTSLPDQKRREALQRIRPILHLIERRFSETLTLDDMANAAHVSRSHCCALFQTALNTSPIAYRNSRRITEARRLLQHTDKTVRTIAYEVGFSSVQEFNRLFLRETGMTPTACRRLFYAAIQNIRS